MLGAGPADQYNTFRRPSSYETPLKNERETTTMQSIIARNVAALEAFYEVPIHYQPDRQRYVARSENGRVLFSVGTLNGELFGFSGPDDVLPEEMRPKHCQK